MQENELKAVSSESPCYLYKSIGSFAEMWAMM